MLVKDCFRRVRACACISVCVCACLHARAISVCVRAGVRIRHQRRPGPSAGFVLWGRRRVWVLEFTRANDYRQDWHETTEYYKTERYRPLRDKMAAGLPPPWSVETVCFTLGIRGSYAEAQWATSHAALDVSPAGVIDLMTTLVPLCLTELDGLYKTRSTALRQRLDA